MSEKNAPMRAGWRPVLVASAAVLAAAGLAAVYGIAGRPGNAGDAACSAAADRTAALKPLATGEVAAVTVADEPRAVPELTFEDADGRERSLSEWRGRTVLLNLWATWCAPCRHEMPALDNLQAEFGGEDFEVVAVSIDTGDPAKPRDFLDETGVEHLAYYADPSTGVFRNLKAVGRAFGMPTTLIIDRNGCELAHLAGPAQWDSQDALKFVHTAIGDE